MICGRISQMNATNPGSGLKNMAYVLVKRLTIKGFLIFDHDNEREPFETEMSKWLADGKSQSCIYCNASANLATKNFKKKNKDTRLR